MSVTNMNNIIVNIWAIDRAESSDFLRHCFIIIDIEVHLSTWNEIKIED